MRRLLRTSLLALWLALCVAPVQAADFFSESFGDFQEELAAAREAGKKGVFVFFEMDECPFCHRMKTTIFNQPDVIAAMKKDFVAFRWDIEGDAEVVDFDGTEGTMKSLAEKKYRVRATPVMIFFNLQGRPVLRYTGPTRTKREFLWMIEYVRDGWYEKMKFARFKRMKKKEAAR